MLLLSFLYSDLMRLKSLEYLTEFRRSLLIVMLLCPPTLSLTVFSVNGELFRPSYRIQVISVFIAFISYISLIIAQILLNQLRTSSGLSSSIASFLRMLEVSSGLLFITFLVVFMTYEFSYKVDKVYLISSLSDSSWYTLCFKSAISSYQQSLYTLLISFWIFTQSPPIPF